MDGSIFEGKSYFKMLGLSISSKSDWGSYIISIAKTATKKIVTWFVVGRFYSPEAVLYLYKSNIRSCMHVMLFMSRWYS